MRKAIIGGYPTPEDGVKITDPEMALTKIDKCYIILDELGAKNTVHFLKHYYGEVSIYAKRSIPKNVKKFLDESISTNSKMNIFQVVRYIVKPLPDEKKLELMKPFAPRILLHMLVKNTTNKSLVDKLLYIDSKGEPTREAIVEALK